MGTRVERSWARIERWLATHAPQTAASLRPPAGPAAIAEAQRGIGVTFPDDLIASLLRHDGCTGEYPFFELPGGYRPASVADIVRAWRVSTESLAAVDTDGRLLGSYWHPAWVPFADTSTASAMVVDCRPGGAHGAVGKLIEGDGTRFGTWPSLGALLAEVADALDDGRPIGSWAPVAFGGRFSWELLQEQHPRPRSLFDLAATKDHGPAVPEPVPGFEPVPEAGWVGHFSQFCLTLVRGIDETELLRRYGVRPDPGAGTPALVARSPQQARDAQRDGYLPVIRVGRFGEWAFGIEEGSWQGIRPATLRRLSAGTRAVAVHHSLFTRLLMVEDGEVVTGYDTRHPGQRAGREPDLLLPALGRARLVPLDPDRYPDEDVRALLDILAGQLGVAVDGDLLRTALPSARLLPLLADPSANRAPSARSEPTIAAVVAHADDARLRAALVAQARRLAAETGLDGYPEVTDALHRAASGAWWRVDDESPLGLRVRALGAEARAATASRTGRHDRHLLTEPERRAWQRRHNAAEAIAAVISSLPDAEVPEARVDPGAPEWGPERLPRRAAAGWLLSNRLDPGWRAQFMADIGEVAVPEGAVEELLTAEQRAAAASVPLSAPVVRRPQRRRVVPNAPQRARAGSAVPGRNGACAVLRQPGTRPPRPPASPA